jgi:hypothetical protein
MCLYTSVASVRPLRPAYGTEPAHGATCPGTDNQCCGAETFCFRSGSDFQKVSVPEPAPTPTLALYLPFITDFIWKSGFFMFFMKEYQPNSHAGFYSIWILIFFTTQADPEPGAGAETSTFRLRLQPKVPAPCGSGSTTLLITVRQEIPVKFS